MNITIEFIETTPIRCWRSDDTGGKRVTAFSSQYEGAGMVMRHMADHPERNEIITLVSVPDRRVVAIVKRVA